MPVSLLGDGIHLVAVAWHVYDLDNDPVALSLVVAALVPTATCVLLFGVARLRRDEERRAGRDRAARGERDTA